MKKDSIEEQAHKATDLMIANCIMMINVYSRKKYLSAIWNGAKWKGRLKYWRRRKKVLAKIVEKQN